MRYLTAVVATWKILTLIHCLMHYVSWKWNQLHFHLLYYGKFKCGGNKPKIECHWSTVVRTSQYHYSLQSKFFQRAHMNQSTSNSAMLGRTKSFLSLSVKRTLLCPLKVGNTRQIPTVVLSFTFLFCFSKASHSLVYFSIWVKMSDHDRSRLAWGKHWVNF